MDARLRVLSGPHAGEMMQIQRGKLLIGREEDCSLRPDSEFVSRHHCVLLLDDYTLRIRDLGSKNGTFVNGRRIGTGETILLHDDTISIGEMICKIDLTQPVVPTGEVATPAAVLQGTGFFEGDTVQADGTAPSLPVVPPLSQVAMPVIPNILPPDSKAETRMLQSPGS